MNENPVPRSGTEALDKALDVLELLADASSPLGVTAVARALDMPKSTAHRLLTAFTRRGYVEQTEAGYGLGMKLVSLGLGVLAEEPIAFAARPVLDALAESIHETCFIVRARAGKLFVLAKVEGTSMLRASPRVGAEVPVHATAAGRLYLAFSPGEVRIGEGPYERFTACTPTSASALAAKVAAAKEAGVDENVDEWLDGLAVVSAPVFRGGALEGVLACAMPSSRYVDRAQVRASVKAAADEIGRRMEGRA